MKNLLIIDIHSMVDVVTNSSSELFICNTDKKVEEVKKVLKEFLDSDNKVNKRNNKFDKVFGEVAVIDETNYKEIVKDILGYSRVLNGLLQPMFGDLPDRYGTELRDIGIPIYEFKGKEDYLNFRKRLDVWLDENKDEILVKLKGQLFIYSKDDNSIPYEIFARIEDTFLAERYHLG